MCMYTQKLFKLYMVDLDTWIQEHNLRNNRSVVSSCSKNNKLARESVGVRLKNIISRTCVSVHSWKIWYLVSLFKSPFKLNCYVCTYTKQVFRLHALHAFFIGCDLCWKPLYCYLFFLQYYMQYFAFFCALHHRQYLNRLIKLQNPCLIVSQNFILPNAIIKSTGRCYVMYVLYTSHTALKGLIKF